MTKLKINFDNLMKKKKWGEKNILYNFVKSYRHSKSCLKN